MKMKDKHFNLLGLKAKDVVTGFKGVITSLSFDLYGCINVLVTPESDKDGKRGESYWYDVARIKTTSKKPVMELPDFNAGYVSDGKKGPEEKPIPA